MDTSVRSFPSEPSCLSSGPGRSREGKRFSSFKDLKGESWRLFDEVETRLKREMEEGRRRGGAEALTPEEREMQLKSDVMRLSGHSVEESGDHSFRLNPLPPSDLILEAEISCRRQGVRFLAGGSWKDGRVFLEFLFPGCEEDVFVETYREVFERILRLPGWALEKEQKNKVSLGAIGDFYFVKMGEEFVLGCVASPGLPIHDTFEFLKHSREALERKEMLKDFKQFNRDSGPPDALENNLLRQLGVLKEICALRNEVTIEYQMDVKGSPLFMA